MMRLIVGLLLAATGTAITTANSNGNLLRMPSSAIQPGWGARHSPLVKEAGRLALVARARMQRTQREQKEVGTRTRLCMSAAPAGSSASKVIIAGAPASGKGTQCALIKEAIGCVHLSTGDMLREAVAKGTEVGKLAKGFMESGQLVPDEVIIGIVKDRLAEPDCQANGWLLDGFPRTRAQADALAEAGITADVFLLLNVPDDELIQRVVGRRLDPDTGDIYHMTFSPPPTPEIAARCIQRSDDTEEKAKVRLDAYHSNIAAIRDSYKEILVEIDGTQAKADVFEKVMSSINAGQAA